MDDNCRTQYLPKINVITRRPMPSQLIRDMSRREAQEELKKMLELRKQLRLEQWELGFDNTRCDLITTLSRCIREIQETYLE